MYLSTLAFNALLCEFKYCKNEASNCKTSWANSVLKSTFLIRPISKQRGSTYKVEFNSQTDHQMLHFLQNFVLSWFLDEFSLCSDFVLHQSLINVK